MPKLENLYNSDWEGHRLGGGRNMTPKEETVDMLKKEIKLILERNRDVPCLKSLLTRALILEKIHHK